MNDVINREDAIDAVLGIEYTAKLNDGDTVVRMSAVNYVLRNLPPAQPPHSGRRVYMAGYAEGFEAAQPKKGRWIPQDFNKKNGMVTTTVYYCPTCSKCGKTGGYDMRYCPNCGARMEESK